jgi:hypothetical protein
MVLLILLCWLKSGTVVIRMCVSLCFHCCQLHLKSVIIVPIKIVFLFRAIFSLGVFTWTKSLQFPWKWYLCVKHRTWSTGLGWTWVERELRGLGVRSVSTQSPWGQSRQIPHDTLQQNKAWGFRLGVSLVQWVTRSPFLVQLPARNH